MRRGKIYFGVPDLKAALTAPRSWAGGCWCRRPSYPTTSAGSQFSQTRTATRSDCGRDRVPGRRRLGALSGPSTEALRVLARPRQRVIPRLVAGGHRRG